MIISKKISKKYKKILIFNKNLRYFCKKLNIFIKKQTKGVKFDKRRTNQKEVLFAKSAAIALLEVTTKGIGVTFVSTALV